MSSRSFLLAAAVVALAASAAAEVTLLSPRAGERLDGGREATIAWSASSLPAHAEEWEAFLSLDGGAYYAVRITPHLDAGVRTFRWRVPNVAASRARLLLRVGDEVNEHVLQLAETFTIVPGWPSIDFASLPSKEAGEAALPGAPPSVEWVSADRMRHRSDDAAASAAPRLAAAIPRDGVAIGGSGSLPRGDRTRREHAFTPQPPRHRDACSEAHPILLLSTRLNI